MAANSPGQRQVLLAHLVDDFEGLAALCDERDGEHGSGLGVDPAQGKEWLG